MNTCVKCRHYEQRQPNLYYMGQAIEVWHRCTRNCKPDPITGEPIGKRLDCREERAEVSHVPSRCGVDGKYYEIKDWGRK